jgi:hypothetical protein
MDTLELFRGICGQLTALLNDLDSKDLATMSLGSQPFIIKVRCHVSHIICCTGGHSRFKLRFLLDKVDTVACTSDCVTRRAQQGNNHLCDAHKGLLITDLDLLDKVCRYCLAMLPRLEFSRDVQNAFGKTWHVQRW